MNCTAETDALAADLHEYGVCRDLPWGQHPDGEPGACTALAAHVLAWMTRRRSSCVTCQGRGVWMDNPCADCGIDTLPPNRIEYRADLARAWEQGHESGFHYAARHEELANPYRVTPLGSPASQGETND